MKSLLFANSLSRRPNLNRVCLGSYWSVNHSYAVGIDDQRFVMLKRVEGGSRELMLTFNFFEELKRLVPTER